MRNLPLQALEINSEAIEKATYEYDNYKLCLTFTNKVKYNYHRVPNFVFEGLRLSKSKGKFINKHVLRQYSYSIA